MKKELRKDGISDAGRQKQGEPAPEKGVRPAGGLEAENPAGSPLVREILLWMEENPDTKNSLEDIAGHFFISTSHLSHSVKKATGIPPLQYMQELRIRRARDLLRKTDLPVGTVAEQTGFSDKAYFSRVFRKIAGMSPTQYRAQSRKQGEH